MQKGIYTPHRVSRITCMVNQLLAEPVIGFLKEIGIVFYEESGRFVRERIKQRPFGMAGEVIRLENSGARLFRFTVPRENSLDVMKGIIHAGELYSDGRGSVFSHDLMEFSKEPPFINHSALENYDKSISNAILLNKLSYVICVLSDQESAEKITRSALNLGICVPVITYGTGSIIRDQLGLIRITIPAEKELVHLLMPEHDSDSITKLLAEQGRLDRPGMGFIYNTPVSYGLMDTRLRMGRQRYAASIEQIIAAIDQLKNSTEWRRRLDADTENLKISKSMLPQDNCEISIISEEDRADRLSEVCIKVGATGAVTSRVLPITPGEEKVSAMIRSAISVPAEMTDTIVDKMLEASTIHEESTDRIQVLDSPAAYVRTL